MNLTIFEHGLDGLHGFRGFFGLRVINGFFLLKAI
ncbi:hypothetical protein NO758_04658 [Planktothrix agardhii]|nr:hypothetical protein NO758_04658 [Planktothrix agardhii]CAH2574788.1 hypothetical protein PRNO82_04152 [Planktothrix rubescens]